MTKAKKKTLMKNWDWFLKGKVVSSREMRINLRILAGIFGIGALAFVWLDWSDRSNRGFSFQANSQTLLLVSIAFGCIIGAIWQISLWLMPSHHREFIVKLRTLSIRDRLRCELRRCLQWRYFKWDLMSGSGVFLAIPFLIWCAFNDVIPFAAFLAIAAVLFSNVPSWVTEFWATQSAHS
jgi:hypothetical protein